MRKMEDFIVDFMLFGVVAVVIIFSIVLIFLINKFPDSPLVRASYEIHQSSAD